MRETVVGLKAEFDRLFGDVDTARLFFAPGKVCLMGDHLDYNGGLQIPMTIDRGTYFIIKKNNLRKIRAFSTQYVQQGLVEFDLEDTTKTNEWSDFIKALIQAFQIDFGFDFVCGGDISMKSGLSASSSFLSGLGYALTSLKQRTIAGIPLALACQKMENEFLDRPCGIIDSFTICNGQKGKVIRFNSSTLQYEMIPSDLEDYVLIIANTHKKRKLEDIKINERESECNQILDFVHSLGYAKSFLCEITDEEYKKILPLLENETLRKRLTYLVTESMCVQQACQAIENKDFVQLGKIMKLSHQSLKNDYEVSSSEMDILVDSFSKQEGCLGAKMTGNGAGGCVIALLKKTQKSKILKNVFKDYQEIIGYEPNFYEVKSCDGTCEIKHKI